MNSENIFEINNLGNIVPQTTHILYILQIRSMYVQM